MSESGVVDPVLPVRARRAIATVATGLLAWVAAVTAARTGDHVAASRLLAFGRSAAAEIYVAAGALQLLLWRTSRAPQALRLAVALIVTGGALPVLDAFAPWTTDGRTVNTAAVTNRVIVLGAVLLFALVWVEARRTAARTVSGLAGAGGLITLAVVVPVAGASGGAAVEGCLAAAWLAFAFGCLRRWSGRPLGVWTAGALAAMSAGELTRMASVIDPRHFLGVAPGFDVAAAALLTALGGIEARLAWQRQRHIARSLLDELTSTHDRLEHVRLSERTRLHDARSAVAGVIGASRLLDREDRIAGDELSRLQHLIAAELTRLQHVLAVEDPEPTQEFDVAAAISPVLVAHRMECPDTEFVIEPVRARGRPHATATAVANLLRNARVHAPGAHIVVRVRRDDDVAEIVVEDAGRGIPDEQRPAMLQPDVRGPRTVAPGHGLGLPSAAAAMSAQGGRLRLDESCAGGVRAVLLLPAVGCAADAMAC